MFNAVLREKVALVTGSTSGIGLGIAIALAKRGCNIVLNGFGDDELITALKKQLTRFVNLKIQLKF